MKLINKFDASKVPKQADFDEKAFHQNAKKFNYLDIEIGCGVGLHPIQYCKKNPERFLLAIERTHEKFTKFQGRVNHHPPFANLFIHHGDAVNLITHYIKSESVDRYIILYPNPYPKSKQQNKRFHCMPFMEIIKKTLKPDGEVITATNEEFYAKEALDWMENQWGFILTKNELLSSSDVPRTHFEKKYLLAGQKCFNLGWKKLT